MSNSNHRCPDCDSGGGVDRRDFLRAAGLAVPAAVVAGGLPLWAAKEEGQKAKPESVVKHLYETLSEEQKKTICFDWDHTEKARGLLRTRISNNWHVTKPAIHSDFYTKDQQQMVRDIFEGIIRPDWHAKIDKQLQDDAGGFGKSQNIAIFGTPGEGKFELVMTGRHMTLRCDGNSADHVAFGGPIFYGHAASGFNEKPDHPGNVFWHQAVAANEVYQMLDGKQRQQALVGTSPRERAVSFRGKDGQFDGIAVKDLSKDQRELVQKVLTKLLEPYRQSDRDEALSCLKTHGGLDGCHLAFYRDQDVGNDQVWDNWRLEGPAFVWYFRGNPHVHVWANISADPSVKTNS